MSRDTPACTPPEAENGLPRAAHPSYLVAPAEVVARWQAAERLSAALGAWPTVGAWERGARALVALAARGSVRRA